MRLSKIFASSCRQNIIRVLSKHKELHIMKLVKEVKSTYLEVNRNLRLLERTGIITCSRVGRGRIVRLNCDNPQTHVLLASLELLDAYDFRDLPKGYDSAFYIERSYPDDNDELVRAIEQEPFYRIDCTHASLNL